MELAPRYCRTCGSRILVKHICHNCNNDPLKGDNYCYDCGALTPNADSCLKCGAKYKQSLPVKPFLYGAILIIAVAAAGYLILNSRDNHPISQEDKSTNTQAPLRPQVTQEIVAKPKPIVNNPVDTTTITTANRVDTIATKTTIQPNKPDSISLVKKITDSASVKKAIANVFTPAELKSYNTKCTYFEKGMRSKVLFFISGGSGYIKINDKIYELKRKRKGVDVAVFGGTEYEAIVTIDGLSGSAKEWLASCSLNIKDLVKNTSTRHKVYSPCIEL